MKRLTAAATLTALATLSTGCSFFDLPPIRLDHEVKVTVTLDSDACPPSPGEQARRELNAIPWVAYPFALGWLEAVRAHRGRHGCDSRSVSAAGR